MTDKDEINFKKAEACHICNKKYTDKDITVRDHCHVTLKYRRSAHQDCNLNFKLTDKISVIFHNLRGYDSHFIMQQIGQIAKNHKDNVFFLFEMQLISISKKYTISLRSYT